MQNWMLWTSLGSALCLAGACGDDGNDGDTRSRGGESGNGGVSAAAKGGTSGTTSGGADAGGPNRAGGAGGAEGGDLSCEVPAPPGVPGGAGGADSEAGLAIVGTFTDNFMGQHAITNSEWTSSDSVFHISEFSNAERWAIALNDEANLSSPCLWSRFDWASAGGKLYYCQSIYNAVSEAAAREATPPDASNLPAGCGAFTWTELVFQ